MVMRSMICPSRQSLYLIDGMQSPASGQTAHEHPSYVLNGICAQDTHTDKVRVETLVQGLMSMQESINKAGADSATSSLFLHVKAYLAKDCFSSQERLEIAALDAAQDKLKAVCRKDSSLRISPGLRGVSDGP